MKMATGRYVCTVCRLEKEPQKPPEHTSEHVKSQKKKFWGRAPRHPIYSRGPTLCICPGPPQSSRRPCLKVLLLDCLRVMAPTGCSCLLVGDFGQLPPVMDLLLYSAAPRSAIADLGRSTYQLFAKAVMLNKVLRQDGQDREQVRF